MELSDEVSTGSGSDWVTFQNSIGAWLETQSLPLPVLTQSSRIRSADGLAHNADNFRGYFFGRDGRQDPDCRNDHGRREETPVGSFHRRVVGTGGGFGARRDRRKPFEPVSAARMDQARGGGCLYSNRSTYFDRKVLNQFASFCFV